MKRLLIAALAATILTPLAATAGDTTVIHERYMESGRPGQVTTTARTTARTTTTRTVVRRHTAVRRAHYVRHRARHPVRRVAHAASATSAGRDTSAVVTTRTEVVPPTPPTAVHRRTIIHRSDDGVVSRHTTVERQNPDGTVSVRERRSTEVVPPPY